MNRLTTILDRVASELEARGLKKLAMEVDVVANTIDKAAGNTGEVGIAIVPLEKAKEYANKFYSEGAAKTAFLAAPKTPPKAPGHGEEDDKRDTAVPAAQGDRPKYMVDIPNFDANYLNLQKAIKNGRNHN